MSSVAMRPPHTKVEPVTDVLHGIEVTDPYRWLEDRNSYDTRLWLEQQEMYTRCYLAAIPNRHRIRHELEKYLAIDTLAEPWKVGNNFFYLRRKSLEEQPHILMRSLGSREEVTLLNPADLPGPSKPALNIVGVSKDSRLLAYGFRYQGQDHQSVGFLDVSSKQVLPDSLPLGLGPSLSFSADGRGFYYSHEIVNSCRERNGSVYWHRFGTPQTEDHEVFFSEEHPKLRVGILGSSDGQLLVFTVITCHDPLTCDLYVQDLVSGNKVRRVLQGVQSLRGILLLDQTLIALTNLGARNLRIVAIDFNFPEPKRWRDIVPESSKVIRDFAVVGKYVSTLYCDGPVNTIEISDESGNHCATLSHRGGAVRFLSRPVETDTLLYECSFYGPAPTIFRWDTRSLKSKVWSKPRIPIDSSSIEFTETEYKSKDGTRVPVFLMAKKRSGNGIAKNVRPAFITGYGGFGSTVALQLNAFSLFLVNHGFLFAIVQPRGGGNLGEQWHTEGKRHKRQNSVDDFVAGAEWLIENGYADSTKIAAGGGSNGALLVGAALTQRPTLFRTAICIGPLMDMLRYHLFDSAEKWVGEFGNSENQEDFHHLRAYSPYHNVHHGSEYPAVMLVSGDADTRCNPLHCRKMAALLQASTASDRPILLDYKPSWGHTPTQPLTSRISALTDRLAFICHELAVRA